uniref:Uncharacterized protein n=1 Tax=Oryza punctata TaxID=4537 RepID=A0A0E0LBJ2_ORYPU
MSERLGGFGPTQEGTRMVRPVPQMPHPRPHMIPQMMANVPTSHWQGGFAPFAGPTQSVPLHAPTYGTNPWQGQSIDYGGAHNHHYVYTYIDDTFLPYMTPTTTNDNNSVTFYMDARHVVWCWSTGLYGLVATSFDKFIDIYIACVGSFRSELMAGFRLYAFSSYGDMSSFGGGSSSVPNELRASQTDDAPQMTQPTQPDDGDFQGNIHDPRRSNRERHEPNRLSLSGPRHAARRRKKTASKRAETSRTMTDHDDE